MEVREGAKRGEEREREKRSNVGKVEGRHTQRGWMGAISKFSLA